MLELEISRDVGGDENVGEFAVCHQQLGHQVDVPIVDTAVLLPWFCACGEVAILLEEVLDVHGRCLTGGIVSHATLRPDHGTHPP